MDNQTNQKTLEEVIHYRRSVRKYKDQAIDAERVKHCLELAVLAPNSSNTDLKYVIPINRETSFRSVFTTVRFWFITKITFE